MRQGVEDLRDPEIGDYVFKTQKSPAVEPFERVKFFKLAWDAIGSEFTSRHQQYEMFYAGAIFVLKNHAFHAYDWNRSAEMVDRLLDSYTIEAEPDDTSSSTTDGGDPVA